MALDLANLRGAVIGGWTVGDKLGAGAMGAVFKATDAQGRAAALKVLQPHLASNKDIVARFTREAKALQRIDHERCCRCLGFGTQDGAPWLALEFISGRSLEAVLKLRGQLQPDEAVDLARQLLEGLGAAHKAGVLHRDVKLANAILRDDGKVVVVDFGLARREDESMKLTAEGAILGTPHYMSPEQVQGQTVDGRADIYAVGACLFHLVTGKPPFSAASIVALLRKHIDERPPSLQSRRPDAPAWLDAWISRCMRKEPADRFADAAVAIAALDEGLARSKKRAGASMSGGAGGTSSFSGAATMAKPAPSASIAGAKSSARLPQPVARTADAGVTPETPLLAPIVGGVLAAFVILMILKRAPLPDEVKGWAPFVAAALAGGAAFKATLEVTAPRIKQGGSLVAARAAAEKGDHASAAAMLEKLAMLEDAAEAWAKAGDPRRGAVIMASRGKWERAGELYFAAGEPGKALEVLRGCGDLEAASGILERLGRSDEAARMLSERAAELEAKRAREQLPSRAVRIDAEIARVVERACKLFQSLGQAGEGARLLARVGRQRDAAELYLEAGDRPSAAAAFLAAGDRERAAEVHERAGDVVAAARIRADLAREQGDRKGAAGELERAGDALAAARMFEDEGDLVRAAELLERGGEKLRAADLFARAGQHLRAGDLFERLERWDDAVRCFREAHDARREAGALSRAGNPYAAGLAFAAAGLPEEARAEFERVAPDSKDRAAARARLAALGAPAPQAPSGRAPRAASERLPAVTVAKPSGRMPAAKSVTRLGDESLGGLAPVDPGATRMDPAPGAPAKAGPGKTSLGAAVGDRTLPVGPPVDMDTPPPGDATFWQQGNPDEEPEEASVTRAREATAQEWVGRTVDRYRVVDVLGEGAYAHVLRAEHVHLERPAALKLLKPVHAAKADVRARFLAEAKLVSRIRHEGVAEVFDFGEVDGTPYMALELIDGRTLREALETRRAHPFAEARALTLDVLAAVEAAHRLGVIHRDLKPENILVDRRGRAHVVDFGMARVFWGGADAKAAPGGFAGTPRYASPEAGRGGDVDARSDQYAIGLVLYELLTGASPFTSDTAVGWIAHHAGTPPPPPSTRKPGCAPAVDPVVLRALEKSPQKRWADLASFANALRAVTA